MEDIRVQKRVVVALLAIGKKLKIILFVEMRLKQIIENLQRTGSVEFQVMHGHGIQRAGIREYNSATQRLIRDA